MKNKLIARDTEIEDLKRCLESEESEFVIVYGRRRIGKTFLIEEFFDKTYDFKFVGGHNLPEERQLKNFALALKRHSKGSLQNFSDWSEAFYALEEYMEAIDDDRKKVIFIDEMPWIDTPGSDFIQSLEYFWNGWAGGRDDILLVATGSSTSWMVDKPLDNTGGLHNRITTRLYLNPFTLKETEEYLKRRRFPWNRYQILQSYMLTGGVPFYLKLLNPKMSLAQNIDRLCFQPKGKLKMEFDELYPALFDKSHLYLKVVSLLFGRQSGMTRSEISDAMKLEGGELTKIIRNLERSDFIARRLQFGNKKKDAIYRLVDFYTIFYYSFIEPNDTLSQNWWVNHMNHTAVTGWMGRSFELICMLHHQQIKNALGISGVPTEISSWRQKGDRKNQVKGAQIDMIIDRSDLAIHLCEMKFSVNKFTLEADYESHVRERMQLFRESTGTDKSLLLTFVTTYGLSNPNTYSSVHSEVTMDDLFNS